MIVAADCPSREQLRQYTLGTLREDSVPGLETHLETCRVCSDTVQQLESQGDSFLDMLNCWKEFPGFELLNEQPFLSAVDHLSQMKIEHSAAAFERMQHSQVLSILDQFPKPGQRLGQYLLLEVAGRGGMGLVYRALHLNLRTTVAVKFLQSSGIDSSQSLDRFRREMQAVGQIVHPNVVRALDAGEAEGIHFLVMEFVDGQDLSAMLKQHGRISTGHACEMIRMAARGLQEIHEAGMVHRDLKPGNLMLSRDGQVRILDLGLALLNPHLSTVGDDLTTTGQLMGTIDYMAPEQADDTHGVDFRADIYGLGATLFALVTGKPPFGGQKKSLLQKLSLLATQSAPLMQNVCPEVSPGLCDIVARMLARDPQQRFASAREVAEALEPYCDSGGLTELLPAAGFPGSGITEQDFTEGTTDASQNTIIVVRSENPLQLSGQNTASIAGTHHGKTSRIRRILNWTGMGLAVVGLSGIAAMLLVNRPLRDISADTASQGLRDVPFITEETPGPNEGRRNSFPDMSIDVAEAERVLSRLASGLRAGLSPSQSAPEWDVFSSSTFPDVRADAIHLAHRYLPVTSVLAHLRDKANPSVRAGLLLALSEYEPGQVMQAVDDLYGDTATFLDSLFYAYVNENDVEVHSCLEFLLRTWGHDKQLEKLRPLLEQKLIPFEGGWFRPLHCSTMVVIPGPRTETPGFADTSTDTRTSAERSGATREVTIPYSFAISTTEVTQAQLRRVAQRFWEKPLPANPNTPANNVYWSQAAEFCNWLTILDGMPVSEQCYIEVQTEQGPKWRQKPEALELSGYRLPTDDEWEIACRAGSKTSRPFGESTRWLDKYVVSSQTSENPVTVSTRKPNAWGLFDMLGNVSEWIQTSSAEAGLLKGKRRIRGGSIWTPVESLTADAQFTGDGQDTSPKMGFRVARTLVKTLQDDAARDDDVGRLQLYVGPPACPDELKKYVDPRFQHMKWKQVVRVGNWNVHTPVCRTFQFRNVSTDPIAFPQLHGLNGHYAFDPEPSLLIEPNSITEFGLRMLPLGTVGERSQHFHFRWGDRKGYDFEPFLVHGCFSGPLLEVLNVGTFGQTPAALDMGIVPINSKVGTSAYVRNVGSEPVFAEVTNVSGPFRLTGQLAGEIFPHRLDHAFQVVLNADVTGPAEGQITIRTTEANPSELTFPVRAVVADSREFSSLAIFRKGTWLIDHNRDAVPDEIIPFGDDGDSPITGDWNGDGVSDLGVWQTNPNGITKVRLQLRGDASESTLVKKSFLITDKLKQILAADRDGDGVSEIGYIVPHPNGIDLNWAFGLQSNGLFSEQFSFGRAADDPVIGDWNGDGKDDIAVARPGSIVAPGNRQWELMWSDLEFPRELIYLSPYDLPVGGDWDGDGDDEPGGWKPLPPSNSSVWQFETDGDSNSNHELIGFGADPQTDKPAVLRSRRKVRQDL